MLVYQRVNVAYNFAMYKRILVLLEKSWCVAAKIPISAGKILGIWVVKLVINFWPIPTSSRWKVYFSGWNEQIEQLEMSFHLMLLGQEQNSQVVDYRSRRAKAYASNFHLPSLET